SHQSCSPGSIPARFDDGHEEMGLPARIVEKPSRSCQAQRACEISDLEPSWHPIPVHPGAAPLRWGCSFHPTLAETIGPTPPKRDLLRAGPTAAVGPEQIGSAGQPQ